MEDITVSDILSATGGTLLSGDENTVLLDICINSKEIKEGDLFVPIIGTNVDAHKFIEGALEVGAATLTSQHNNVVVADKPYIRVNDTVKALQDIGCYIRNRYNIPVVGVTGSVGKTTTREMITTALRTKYKTFHTKGNFNSQIGVPITLSKLSREDEIAVLELGMSEPGQIVTLSKMVKPSLAVVTTIGVAHIEYMKTQENIRKEKLSIVEGMSDDGVLLLNGDDLMLAQMRDKMPGNTLFYGCEDWCDYKARKIVYREGKSFFELVYKDECINIELNALGKHNVANCVGAMAVAHLEGIPFEVSKKGFLKFEGQRQQIIELEGRYTIIDDTYNASPPSVRASIDVLCDMPVEGKKYLVLADMLELGEDASTYHYDIGKYLSNKKIDEVIVVGELAMNIKRAIIESCSGIKTYSFSDNEEVAIYLMAVMQPADVVLLKGSNSMHLNEVVQILKS